MYQIIVKSTNTNEKVKKNFICLKNVVKIFKHLLTAFTFSVSVRCLQFYNKNGKKKLDLSIVGTKI